MIFRIMAKTLLRPAGVRVVATWRSTLPLQLVAILLLAGCSQTPKPNAGDSPTSPAPNFDALRNGWIGDLQSKNLDASLARYSSDAVFFNPDGSHVEGAPAIRSLFKQVFATYQAQIRMNPLKVLNTKNSDVAADSGSYSEDLTVLATHAVYHTAGDYLILYRRAPDGHWLIVEQVWTEIPATTSKAATPQR